MLNAVQNILKIKIKKRRIAALKTSIDSLTYQELFDQCLDARILPEYLEGMSSYAVERFVNRITAHEHALCDYEPKSINAKVHLFTAENNAVAVDELDPHRGWLEYIDQDNLIKVEVEGSHQSIVAQHADNLVAQVNKVLSARQSSPLSKRSIVNSYYHLQRSDSSGPALICFPGAGDNITAFTPLTNAVIRHQCIIGVQPSGTDGSMLPHTSIEAASRSTLGALKDMNLHQSPILLGHSYGGWQALEVALQLQAQNTPVASLVIVDSEAPDERQLFGQEYSDLEVYEEYCKSLNLTLDKPLDIDVSRMQQMDIRSRLQYLHSSMVQAGLLPAGSQADVIKGPFACFANAIRDSYKASAFYQGTIYLIFANDENLSEQENLEIRQETIRRWSVLAQEIVPVDSNGNHITMLKEEYVGTIARVVTKLEDRATITLSNQILVQ